MNNYSQWRVLHYMWDSLRDFGERWNSLPGIHTITFDNSVSIDIYVNENVSSADSVLPVFFGGAVSNRSKKVGPFFSGLSVSRDLEIPMISVADPSLSDQDLEIGWYTGGPNSEVQRSISDLLISIQEHLGVELLLVGGSGGGFAALAQGLVLKDRCSLLIWNAQTDIYEYSERFAKQYLRSLFGFAHSTLRDESWKSYCKPRTNKHVLTDVLRQETLFAPRRVLYFQNNTDWHFIKHLKPLWDLATDKELVPGVNILDEMHVVLAHDYVSGHAPLPVKIVEWGIAQMMNRELTVADLVFPREQQEGS